MTPNQHKVFHFIRDRIAETGICPSYDEIGERLGVASKSVAYRVVEALIRDGYLVRGATGAARSLRLADADLRDVPTSALIAELERRGVRF